MNVFGGILDILLWLLNGGRSPEQRFTEANIERNKRQAEWLASEGRGNLADYSPTPTPPIQS